CWAKCNHPSKALCADEVGQLVDENEEPDLLCLYYLPKMYYHELRT
ncbi:hypothetical protein LCGC14_2558900, partial [marine sediment metagenome]